MAASNRPRKASFGSIRKLPSGRFQARYTGPDRKVYTAKTRDGDPLTFQTWRAADAWLADKRTDIRRDEWSAPAPKSTVTPMTFRECAQGWLVDREHAILTRELYEGLLKNHIYPAFGDAALREITYPEVKQWHLALATRTGRTARAHAYALLRAILNHALMEELIDSNPCKVRGAGQSKRKRTIEPATPDEVEALAEAMPDEKYRMIVLVAAWCAPRYGELAELRRFDVDLAAKVLRIRRSVAATSTGRVVKTPKSDAGIRNVDIPPHLVPELKRYLDEHVAAAPDALLFPNQAGEHLCESTVRGVFRKARKAVGLPDLRIHDLRHTGAVFAALGGAGLKELMDRLGHSTPSASLMYQHTASGRGKEIAAGMSRLADGNVTPIEAATSAKKSRRRPA